MSAAHILTVALSATGWSYAFECPHDGTGVDKLPPGDRPACRRADGGDCLARATFTELGGPTAAWLGPPLTLAAVPVDLVYSPSGVLIEHAATRPLGPTECARRLADASGCARYTEPADGWQQLLDSEHLVEHAYRQALRRGTDKAAADAWRAVLRDWHDEQATADTAGVRP